MIGFATVLSIGTIVAVSVALRTGRQRVTRQAIAPLAP
jgi:hypothetical protein